MEFLCIALAVALLAIIIVVVFLLKSGKGANKNNELLRRLEESDRNTREEMAQNRSDTQKNLEGINALIREIQENNIKNNEKMAEYVAESIKKLQDSNEIKLEAMRNTVDEKLTKTLNERINSSFEVVNSQLEKVHKSLGEMQQLAGSVSDLQRVLTNVKSRGTWAEIQLGNILEDILSPAQFERNVSPKDNADRVEFVVKIPSKIEDGKYVLLPIDSKFPQEDYIRLCEAAENADKVGVEEASKSLVTRIKNEAKKISEKYINVPYTTNFAIMYLPTEGLYAEVMRKAELVDEVQTKYKIMICGPTTISAFLNTLSIGFNTLALNKKSSEIWEILGVAKQQFNSFGELVAKARKQIEGASTTLEKIEKKSSQIQNKLKSVDSVNGGYELKEDESLEIEE